MIRYSVSRVWAACRRGLPAVALGAAAALYGQSGGQPGGQTARQAGSEGTAAQAPAQAQAAPAQPLAFDVVSIKPHKDEGMQMRIGMRVTADGFAADGVPLEHLLTNAFNVSKDRVLNVPEWASSSRYDIEAKVAPEDAAKLKALDQHQRWAMLVPVLEDRFAFKFHHENRELQVYTLVPAKGGPKLKEAAATDAKGDEMADAPPAKPGTERQDAAPKQGMMMRMSPQGVSMESHDITMGSLAQMLSLQMGSTVEDKTGLKGKYDISLTWMPEQGAGPMGMARGAPPADENAQAQDPVGPSIFAALQEQLGLKLVAQKASVDVVVIDHIEKPSEN